MKNPESFSFRKIVKILQDYLGGNLAALLLWLIFRSLRWQRDDLKELRGKGPFIAAFWHGRQLILGPLCTTALPDENIQVLISSHADGRVIARAVSWFGLGSVPGSSTRGGMEATRKLIRFLKHGAVVAITPDGPKGPLYKSKDGVVMLASLAHAPIYPMSISADRVWRFKSWDKMILPKPFSKAVCVVGKPIYIDSNVDSFDAAREVIDAALIEVTTISDALVHS